MTPLSFNGSGAEYFRIWIVNVLLIIVTLGLYYPWAKVRSNRYFAANTELDGRNFEYHATGKQLLPGYLISIVLLMAFVILQNLHPAASGALVIVGLLLFPWIIWRSVTFRMRMTSFSNVRFGFDGTAGGAYFAYLLVPVVGYLIITGVLSVAVIITNDYQPPLSIAAAMAIVVLAIGLGVYVYAYARRRRTEYLINGYRFGQGRFSTSVSTGKFAGIIVKTWFVALVFLTLSAVAFGAIAMFTGIMGELGDVYKAVNAEDPEAMADIMAGSTWMLIPILYLLMIFLGFLVVAYAYTRNRRYIMEQSMLDGKIGFHSSLSARSYGWVMASNLVLVMITLGLGMPWARVRTARLIAQNSHVNTTPGFDDYLTQKQAEQSALGEQIGDAFDVDVGVGF